MGIPGFGNTFHEKGNDCNLSAIHYFMRSQELRGSTMRASGILMHITSLPSPYGVGTMGKEAYEFVDFLCHAGQRYWQILPLTPTGYGDSPYQSCSAFAGNPYLIDLERLVEEGLLKEEEISDSNWGDDPGRVDFGLLYENRLPLLRKAYARFREDEAFYEFIRRSENWLPEFAHFMALKDRYGGKPWYEWPDGIKHREISEVNESCRELSKEIRFYCFVQFLFDRQWNALRDYAHEKGVSIIGDVPIYVPYDSVEVWSNSWLFQLDEGLAPRAVAGCPPDYFNENGQLWGNPLYRWDVHKKDGYRWWLQRLQGAANRYDVIRIDHFRAFAGYYAIPHGEETAKNGRWMEGPGMDFIGAVKEKLPGVRMIAEDLGFLTQEVLDMRDASGLPGMKVLEFAFDSREPSEYLPYQYPQNSVCYTGTHDNMTMQQWFDNATKEAVEYATEYMSLTEREGLVWGVIRTAMSSVSNLCVVQLQDYLGLGGEARMNFPGTQSDANWTWRLTEGHLTNALAEKIKRLSILYGRYKEKKIREMEK